MMKCITRKMGMLALMLQAFLIASAYDFEVDGICYNVISHEDLTCEVTEGYYGLYRGDIIIPSTVKYKDKELSVIAIGTAAFRECERVYSVVLPEGLTTIGLAAFRDCCALTSVVLPESLTTIEKGAFNGCNKLTSVTLPEGLSSIGEYAFYNCTHVTSIAFPKSLTTIGLSAFQYSGLTSIAFSEGLTTIGASAFKYCNDLTYVAFPDGLTTIGESAFEHCGNLTSVTFSESLSTIEKGAFMWCNKLTSIAFPEGLTTIGESAFQNCQNLTSVAFSESLTTIESYAFYKCSGLTSVSLPESMTTIGSCAFQECYNLESVTFPKGLTTIGSCAFQGCTGLTSVSLPESMTTIGSCAFQECYNLESVTFPRGLTTIESSTFRGCNLTSVIFPDALTSIGESAFAGNEMTSVIFPSSLTKVGGGAFRGCGNLISVKFEYSLKPIVLGFELFKGCEKLEEVYFPRTCLMYPSERIYRGPYSSDMCRFFDQRLKYLKIGDLCINVSGYGRRVFAERKIETIELDNLVWANGEVDGDIIVENLILSEHYNKEKPDTSDDVFDGYKPTRALCFDLSELKKIVSKLLVPPEFPNVKFGDVPNNILKEAEVLVPIQALEKYQQAPVWKDFWNLKGVEGLVDIESSEVVAVKDIGQYDLTDKEVGRYDLTGKAVSEDYRGIVIVRYSDGSTSKTVQR